MELIRVVQRPQEYEMVRWDGSAGAAQWATEKFGDQATITGDGDDRTLHMWGSWEIPRGDYIADQWGTFGYIPVDQLNTWQLAAPEIEPAPLFVPPAEEPPPEEPPAEEPPAEEPPTEEPPAEEPVQP